MGRMTWLGREFCLFLLILKKFRRIQLSSDKITIFIRVIKQKINQKVPLKDRESFIRKEVGKIMFFRYYHIECLLWRGKMDLTGQKKDQVLKGIPGEWHLFALKKTQLRGVNHPLIFHLVDMNSPVWRLEVPLLMKSYVWGQK